jgi:hypothetical protein
MEDPRSVENAELIAGLSARLLKLYSERYRAIEDYPQYHIAEMPNFASGISSGNMIGLTSATWHTIQSEEHPKTTLAHEYVHPFVIPVVPREDPLFALSLEGFPSYFHLPILAEVLGEEWYLGYMARVEKAYLDKKNTGKGRGGTPLPPDKPLAALTADDVSTYKDTFLLNDRTRLFFHYLLTEMGREGFWRFTRALCGSESMDWSRFKALIEGHLPGSSEDVKVWLEETGYPDRFRLER